MRLLVLSIGLFFCLFPYTQILEIEAYNQPYALLFCTAGAVMSFDQLARDFPRRDLLLLFFLAALGIVFFLFTCMPDPNAIELKSLLSYLSAPIFCMAGFALARSAPALATQITVWSAFTWFFVGAVQTFVSPTFATQFVGQWEDAAAVVVESGRGVLGLAPEPTPFGFHMLVVGTALIILRDRLLVPGLCVLAAILFARSSSAVLAILLGTVLYLAIHGGRVRIALLAAVPGYLVLSELIRSGILPDDVRLFQLAKLAIDNPALLLAADSSVNARIGGIIVGIQEILRNDFIPFGMSNDDWVNGIGRILGRNSWLIDVSTSGVPSGILVIVYHTGFLGLIVLAAIFRRLFSLPRSKPQAWFISVMFFVFLSQYYISTPGFGLIYGLVLARYAYRSRKPCVEKTPSPSRPSPIEAVHGTFQSRRSGLTAVQI